MDYKDWIWHKANELSLEKYNMDYDDLPGRTQLAIYQLACELYKDYYAAQINAAQE